MYGDHLWRSILQTLHTLYLWSQSGNTKSARHSPNATKSPAGRPKELSSIAQMAKGYFIEKEAFLSVLATWIFVGLPDFTELVAQMARGLWHFWCSLPYIHPYQTTWKKKHRKQIIKKRRRKKHYALKEKNTTHKVGFLMMAETFVHIRT